ncbi:MAG: hypothetical protein H7Y04_06480 [Verrucomicrobia bacterium]|nr:hypothetical protein [Cytophagales bacterium]
MDVKEKRYDLTFLKMIAGNDEDGLKEIIEKFIINTPPEIILLEQAILDKDCKSTEGYAHKLKSNARFFHIGNLAIMLRDMETACANDGENVNFELFISQIAELKSVYAEVFEDLKQEIA